MELKKLRLQALLIFFLAAAIIYLTVFDPFHTEPNIFPLSRWSYVTISISVFTSIYFFMWMSLSIVHVSVKDEPLKKAKFNPHSPLASIILPCRNEAGVISNAIEQSLNQTYRDIEVIVIAKIARTRQPRLQGNTRIPDLRSMR